MLISRKSIWWNISHFLEREALPAKEEEMFGDESARFDKYLRTRLYMLAKQGGKVNCTSLLFV